MSTTLASLREVIEPSVYRPISNPAGDVANEAELRSSEKERAEHVMLVDLGRNDIGRVSKPGTVRVPELMRVEGMTAPGVVEDVAVHRGPAPYGSAARPPASVACPRASAA